MKKNADLVLLIIVVIILIMTHDTWLPYITTQLEIDTKKNQIELYKQQKELDSLKKINYEHGK